MSNKLIFIVGILGASLFVISSIVGGFLIEDYSLTSQYISESYAIDTEYGLVLRSLGYIPRGILFTIFVIAGYKKFPQFNLTKIGFFGMGMFYGIATIVVGFFPCDSGCNKELINPSVSQIIHNLTGLLTYIFVPICMILIGFSLKKLPNFNRFSILSITYGTISILFIFFLFSNSNSDYIGLYQRMVEIVFIIWIITCANIIKNKKPTVISK